MNSAITILKVCTSPCYTHMLLKMLLLSNRVTTIEHVEALEMGQKSLPILLLFGMVGEGVFWLFPSL